MQKFDDTARGPLDGVRMLDQKSRDGLARLKLLLRHSEIFVENGLTQTH
jgi:hypothetical protein